jgi:hemerythrin-like domain-containing protein
MTGNWLYAKSAFTKRTLKLYAMHPTLDIKGEHASTSIILDTMKKLAVDMCLGKFIDSYRIVQIIGFLHTLNQHSHYEKEEKCLYPALLGYDVPWTADTINHLISEHKLAQTYITEIDTLFEEYLSGNSQITNKLALCMINYVEHEKRHIKILDNVVLPLCEKLFDKSKLKSVSSDFKKLQDQNVGHLNRQEYRKLLSMLNAENEIPSERVYY